MTEIFSLYLYISISLSFVFAAIWILGTWADRFGLSPKVLSRYLAPILLGIALVSPLWILQRDPGPLRIVSQKQFTVPAVDAASSEQPFASAAEAPNAFEDKLSVNSATKATASLAIVFWFLITTGMYLRNLAQTMRLVSSSIPLRKVGNLQLLVCALPMPMAFRLGRRAYILLPQDLITEPTQLLMALKHEGQHHRHGDTLWIHGQSLLRRWFLWNPILHKGIDAWCDLQERACDEALVGHQSVCIRSYRHLIVSLAKSSLAYEAKLAGTTGMALGAAHLKKRILSMERYQMKKQWLPHVLSAGIALAAIGGSCFAAQEWTLDRSFKNVDLAVLAHNTSGVFPIEVNEHVAKQVMRYAGTAQGRDFVEHALERRAPLEDMLRQAFRNYDIPEELLAVPLMESGYANLPENPNGPRSAGMWQFVPSTARHFGLRVDHVIDERLDVTKATDAALRYLKSLYLRFGDWRLAVLSYYAGETRVQRTIDRTGSKEPWDLIDAGVEGEHPYLAKIMAGALILSNPELMQ